MRRGRQILGKCVIFIYVLIAGTMLGAVGATVNIQAVIGNLLNPIPKENIAEELIAEERAVFDYDNTLHEITDGPPIFQDLDPFVSEFFPRKRFQVSPLVQDENADLLVRSWRVSYNAGGIIEMDNYLDSSRTAIIVVHPWGVDGDDIVNTPKPYGAWFLGNAYDHEFYYSHLKEVVNPFLSDIMKRVNVAVYSLPGDEDEIRGTLYPSILDESTDVAAGMEMLNERLESATLFSQPWKDTLVLDDILRVTGYLSALSSIDASPHYIMEMYITNYL